MAKRKTNASRPAARRRGARRLATKPVRRTAGAKTGARAQPKPATRDGDVPPPRPAFPIIGIGASAGGLEACSQLLAELPADLGAALIVVMHLAPDHASVLPELLGGTSKLPVVHISDGMRIEPNRICVIPPNTQLGIIDGKLRLTPRPADRTQYKPVDFFFRSLAAYAQSRAIGIVLSGSDTDGAVGLREIKEVGGITIAQEPTTAKYDGMPRAAIQTGLVDLVLPPDEVARELVRIARHPFVAPALPARPGEDLAGPDEHLHQVFILLRKATGVDFSHYKLPTIRRRLQRRMVLHKISGVEQYLKLLRRDPGEVRALHQDLLILVTRFFRDPESFNTLTSKVFARIVPDRGREQPLRIWVPGCSTGEEAYSVAIALLEFLGNEAQGVLVQIFATDVSETAVEQARLGSYPESIAADVSPERLRRFFAKTGANYRISKTARDMCVFARQDLTRDPPFSKLDLILCRNVLIYLSPTLQRRLMSIFHYALQATGFLMLGAAETVGPNTDLFAVADKRHRLYTKKLTVVRTDLQFPPIEHASGSGEPSPRPSAEVRSAGQVQNEANLLVLSRYAPPGVIVDNDLQIIQFRGPTGAFLEPASGEASLSLFKMAREGLLHALRTALHEVRKSGKASRKEGLRVRHNGTVKEVNLEVVPLNTSGEIRHFLVLFENAGQSAAPQHGVSRGKSRPAPLPREKTPVRRLQEELAASREYLQSIIQDREAANEELQSANEEILSANEELQSTNEELDTAKEELQSTNEELNTVNEELQARNEELSRVNSDLVNLLGSVQIPIVMVAGDLRIRRFTATAEKVLNLIPSDLGRPISDIKPNIDCPELEKLISDAVETVSIQEREVRDRLGNSYLLRVRPYKNLENRIDGAVLALFDIDAGRGQEIEARQGEQSQEKAD